MNKIIRFCIKKPLLTFIAIYLFSLIVNRLVLFDFQFADFHQYTWMLVYSAMLCPAFGFIVAILLVGKIKHKDNSLFRIKISKQKLKFFYFIALALSTIFTATTIVRTLEVGDIFITAAVSNSSPEDLGILYDKVVLGKIKQNIFLLFLSPITFVGPTLPVLLATCQHLARLSNTNQKDIAFFNKINILCLALIMTSSLITGSRSLVVYPLLVYCFTSTLLGSSVLKSKKVDIFNQKNTGFGAKIKFAFGILLSLLAVISIGVFRLQGRETLTSSLSKGNPIHESFLNIFTYFFFGFDVLNKRVSLLMYNQWDGYTPGCNLRTVIPYYNIFAKLFDLPITTPEQCLKHRFHFEGYTASTYLTFLPINNFVLVCCVLSILGFVWGIAFVYCKRNVLAYVGFILISVGMLFSGFTNFVIRDFAICGAIFLYPLLAILFKSKRGNNIVTMF